MASKVAATPSFLPFSKAQEDPPGSPCEVSIELPDFGVVPSGGPQINLLKVQDIGPQQDNRGRSPVDISRHTDPSCNTGWG